jgi:hypothetical protein
VRGLVRAIVISTAVSMVASGATAAGVDGASEGPLDGRVLMSPLAISLEIAPSTVRPGELAGGRVTVTNLGPIALSRISIRLRFPSELLLRGRQPLSVRRLASGASASVTWLLCGRTPGSYLVFAEATFGSTFGSLVVDSPARLLAVRPGTGRCPGPGASKRG